jgi:hypothetical protein
LKGDTTVLTCEDGDCRTVFSKPIRFTDFQHFRRDGSDVECRPAIGVQPARHQPRDMYLEEGGPLQQHRMEDVGPCPFEALAHMAHRAALKAWGKARPDHGATDGRTRELFCVVNLRGPHRCRQVGARTLAANMS